MSMQASELEAALSHADDVDDLETLGVAERVPRRRGFATALACLSFGLGAAALLAPDATARLLGARPSGATRRVLYAVGLREIGAGAGLLGTRRAPGAWTWLRVAGDVMDLAMLTVASQERRSDGAKLATAVAAISGILVVDVLAAAAQSR